MGNNRARLDSWKAIADYLGRDVRTVRRWEKERNLPVHRVPGKEGGTVFAYAEELDGWLNGAQPSGDALAGSAVSALPSGVRAEPLPAVEAPAASGTEPLHQSKEQPRRALRLLPLAGALLAGAVLLAAGRWYFSSRAGAPVRVSLAGKKLIAWDASGRESWEYEFPQPAEFQLVQGQPYNVFTDLVGDGGREVIALIILKAESPASETAGARLGADTFRSTLYCFSENGRLLWSYVPDLKLSFAGRSFEGPWPATAMVLTPAARGQTVWVAYRHHTWWPSFVERIDARGSASLAFVNAGTIWVLASVRNSSGQYVLAGGINNELGSAALAVLRDGDEASSSPPLTPGGPYTNDTILHWPHLYVAFPTSELFRLGGGLYDDVGSIVVERDRIQVATNEGKDPTGEATLVPAFYEFTKDFELTSATLGDDYWRVHRVLESQGKISHPAARCPDRAIASRVREFAGSAWFTPSLHSGN